MERILPTGQREGDALVRALGYLRLQPGPFAHLEASADPALSSYLVGHELFGTFLEETPTIMYAPAGGGKTAARLYATRACWFGLGGTQLFPLPYLPKPGPGLTAEVHRSRIAHAGAAALFVGLLYRPALFLQLSRPGRQAVGGLFNRLLPSPLARYTAMLRSGEAPPLVAARLVPSYNLPSPPALAELAEFLDALEQASFHQSSATADQDPFQQLLAVLFETMQFRAVLLQIDGVDATPETINDLAMMAQVVAWPLRQAAGWARQRIYVKAALPAELEPVLSEQLSEPGRFAVARISWTTELLAEVIRRRVYVASGEAFGSLDAMSSPGLRDVEIRLARIAAPLPREILHLTNCLFAAFAARAVDDSARLELQDIDAAAHLYSARSVTLPAAPLG